MKKDFDVIVIGAGPGGSSVATFLGRQGLSTLLLDRSHFPRDKVCGDGLAPQAIYWLDMLGCVDEVLERSRSCITAGDMFVNGEYVLTGKIPQNSPYPGFCTLLERKKLDDLLVRNAVSYGAVFKPNCRVKRLNWQDDGIVVEAESNKKTVHFKGRLVIGADGASSVVSRSVGNIPRDGTMVVSVRAYYEGVDVDESQIQLYFDERFFPGYGWVFVNDDGKANIGLGYAFDNNFPAKRNLKKAFNDFVQGDLKERLAHARPVGRPSAGWASFFRPKSMVADRVMLIGDAANLTDPINGGGIHIAMESAYSASYVALQALASGDCSAMSLRRYETLWKERSELDWRTGELLLCIAKNPHLRELYLFLLKAVARLTKEDGRFEDFCGGVFCGLMPASKCISPLTLLEVTPLDPRAWLSAFANSDEAGSLALLDQALSAVRNTFKMTGRVITNPLMNLNWGAEISTKALRLTSACTEHVLASAVNTLEQRDMNIKGLGASRAA